MVVLGLRVAAVTCLIGAAIVAWHAQPVEATGPTYEQAMAALEAIGRDRPRPALGTPAQPWDVIALGSAAGMLVSGLLFAAAASGLTRLEEIRDALRRG